jgi:hypothetical protein
MYGLNNQGPEELFPHGNCSDCGLPCDSQRCKDCQSIRDHGAAETIAMVQRDFPKVVSGCPSCRRKPKTTAEIYGILVGCRNEDCIGRTSKIFWSEIREALMAEGIRPYASLLCLLIQHWAKCRSRIPDLG